MATYPGFVGPSYTSPNKIACDDRVVNWFPSKIESGTGPAAYVFDPAPGYTSFCTLASSPVRGFYTLNGASFAVADDDLYQLPTSSGGSATLLASGLNNPDDSPVTMAGNGDGGFQLMITSGSKLYCYDFRASTLTLIPDITATVVTFAGGYFLALNPNTSTFYFSALEDGSSWDLGDVVQRNDQPDKWLAAVLSHKEYWLFGSQTTSVYYNSGNDPPWIPNPSVSIPYGSGAPNSVALLNGVPVWLAQDLTVRMAQGYTATRISTHALEWALEEYSTVLDADAFTYEEQGHYFYVLNFPTANATWVYDLTTGQWHERGVWNGLDFDVLAVWGCVASPQGNLVGSRTTGAVYLYSQRSATETDGTTGIVRLRRAPHLVSELKLTAYDRFQLHMEVGIGLSSGQGSDPLVMLRWSNDGGQSFGNTITASAGAIGVYRTRVIFRRLGSGRDRVFEVRVSDPVPWRLVAAYLDFRVGAS